MAIRSPRAALAWTTQPLESLEHSLEPSQLHPPGRWRHHCRCHGRLAGCSSWRTGLALSRRRRWEAWQGPVDVSTGLRRRAAALRHHRTQPPHPALAGGPARAGVITLRTDRERVLPHTDPLAPISSATARFGTGDGTAQGVASQVQLWPQGRAALGAEDWDDRPVARITRYGPVVSLTRCFAQVLQRRAPY